MTPKSMHLCRQLLWIFFPGEFQTPSFCGSVRFENYQAEHVFLNATTNFGQFCQTFFSARCILFFSPLGSLPRFVVFFRHKAFHLRIGTTTIRGTSSFFLIPYICNFTFSSSSSAIYLSNFLCVSIRRKDLEQSKKSN